MRREISFFSGANQLVGDLFLPDSGHGKHPAIVLVGAASGTRRQTPTVYAERFVELGYAVLIFDHTSYGDSEGTPRSDEDPFVKSEDIKWAVTFLEGCDEVDAGRIGAVGVCGGGGFVTYTAVSDQRIKAVATISAIVDSRGMVTSGIGGPWRDLMQKTLAARSRFASGGDAEYVPFRRPGPQSEWSENGNAYYLTERNPDPNWKNQTLVWSFDKLVQFSALDVITLLAPTPLLLIAGAEAETVAQSQAAYDKAQEPKELHLIPGGKHFDFYDQPAYVGAATSKIDAFMLRHL